MNDMKIIQVIPLLDLAGAETMCENLTNSLLKLGHEVTVVSLYNYHSAITERMQRNGINIIYLNKKNGIDVSIIFKLIKIFKEYNPDVVHSHLYAGKYAHIAASICRIPCKIYTIHNIAEKEAGRLNRLFNRFLFKKCNVIPVSLSEEIRKSVMKEYNMESATTPVVFNGVPMDKCHKKKDYAGNNKILHVGRFATAKNHEVSSTFQTGMPLISRPALLLSISIKQRGTYTAFSSFNNSSAKLVPTRPAPIIAILIF